MAGAPVPPVVTRSTARSLLKSVRIAATVLLPLPLSPVGSGRQFQLPTGTALLVVHRGPGEGTEYTLRPAEGTVTVGRAPESGIFLDDVTVSRRHAELRYGAEGWSIRDDGSLNGTYVNRVRVDDHRLSGGDEVQIGKFRFVFLLGLEGPHETPGQ